MLFLPFCMAFGRRNVIVREFSECSFNTNVYIPTPSKAGGSKTGGLSEENNPGLFNLNLLTAVKRKDLS